jgi:4-amino-4-deoxy-L-arabinose transferase-like glycosyltransferase
MEIQPAICAPRSSLIRLWPWLILLLVLLFTGFIRFRLLDMPLERDEGEYAYAGQLILQGIPPYELAYNMKLPGTYFAYALGMAAFGQTPAGIHLILIVANSLTIIFVFLLGRKLFGAPAGLAACASYGILSVSPVVLGMAAHANHFVVLFAVPATLLLWKWGEAKGRWSLFFSGLLYGLAFLMKQQGICFCLFGWIFFVWQEMKDGFSSWIDFYKRFFLFGAGMFLPFGLTCLFLAYAGVFSKFWFWTFTYARSYVSENSWKDGIQILWSYLKTTHRLYLGFCILAAAGLPFAVRDKSLRRQLLFVALLFAFSFFGVSIGFYFRRHYFILLLPAFAILIGMAVRLFQQTLRGRVNKNISALVPAIVFTAVLGWNVFIQKSFFFQMSGIQISKTIYADFPFVESLEVARYIREHSAAGARIAVVGSEPQIYFYAQRRSATGYIYTYALMEPQPAAVRMQKEMMREIESNKPEYLVWIGYGNSWLARPDSNLGIFDWFEKYAGKFYDAVGVLDARSNATTVYLWNAGAKNFGGTTDQYITIYKRKPPSEISSKAD